MCLDLLLIVGENKNDLSTLYRFITGAESDTPWIGKNIIDKFKHGCMLGCRCRPTASACDPNITFPIHFEEVFEIMMAGALAKSCGFGFV